MVEKRDSEIINLWENTEISRDEIANMFNITPTRVSQILEKNNSVRTYILEDLEGEEWVEYKGIWVSDKGRCKREINEKTRKGFVRCDYVYNDGYVRVRILKHSYLVHRIVILAFTHIEEKTHFEVHHLDGNKENNSLENLQVIYDRKDHVEKHSKNIQDSLSKRIIGINSDGDYIIFKSATQLSKEYPTFNQSAIRKCCNGLQKHHKGYYWHYIKDGGDLPEEYVPPHYNRRVQPIDIIDAFDLNFNMGSALKYIARSKFKHQELSDLNKAIYYLNKEIERIKSEGE